MRIARLALVVTAVAACSSRVEPISVTVLTKGCSQNGAPNDNPVASVDHYQVSISGPQIPQPIVTNFAAGGAATIPDVPPGSARVMTIQGFQGDPTGTGATLMASGVSQPFSVPVAVGAPVKVAVVLRATGAFSGANEASTPGTCATLSVPRAGHTATLLSDGTVLIAGGFSVSPNAMSGTGSNELNWVFRNESEIFDPRTGSVTAAAPMQDAMSPALTYQRAFHTGTLITTGMYSGNVLIFGGEVVPDGGTSVESQESAAAYDPSLDSWAFVGGPQYAVRSRHVALYDSGMNNIILLGGLVYGGPGATPTGIAGTPAWFNVNSQSFSPVYLKGSSELAVFGGVGSAIAQWQSAFIGASGFNLEGTEPSGQPTVGYLQWSSGTGPDGGSGYGLYYETDSFGITMSPARNHTAMVSISQSSPADHVLIAGGFGAADAGAAVSAATQNIYSTDGGITDGNALVLPAVNTGTPLAHALGDLCSVALADGRAFTAGGDNGTLTSTDAAVWSISAATGLPTATSPATLSEARKWHSCTLLADGSVAVIGGVDTTGGGFKILGSIEIYNPTQLTSSN